MKTCSLMVMHVQEIAAKNKHPKFPEGGCWFESKMAQGHKMKIMFV